MIASATTSSAPSQDVAGVDEKVRLKKELRLFEAVSVIVGLIVGTAFLTFLNCWNMKVTKKIQDVFLITKLTALVVVIVSGLAYMFSGHYENFDDPFKGSATSPAKVAVSFYQGMFAYTGFNYLNYMIEEVKDPYVNLPRAIYISMPLVTCLYVLANIAYLAVLSPEEMLASSAIAVGIMSLCYLSTSDVYRLIDYSAFVESSFICMSVTALLYFRYKIPDAKRPVKVPTILPICFLAMCLFLVVFPVFERWQEVLAAILITGFGVPVYFTFVWWQTKPAWLANFSRLITTKAQKLFLSIPQEDYDEEEDKMKNEEAPKER
ncbi:unnamed protein product [Notodromas monacha]|uniref:Uncharacterized protein n=1 Tax=Notodromas monacha TaxID=399045 RepID=A0A7R9BE05_9CRUS|nr:unnamed protein product [Notodromas monacha]CAG0913590.1 unnamed protein product [Notodromas monacha]